MELRLPPDKLEALTQLLEQWHNIKRKITKRELLSLIGKLSFAAKVIPAGRIFFRRLIDLSTSVTKLHHHITLNAHAKEDIKINSGWISYQGGMESVSCCNHIGIPPLSCNCTQMPQGRSALEHTSRVHGSWVHGLTHSSQDPSSGRNCSHSSLGIQMET